MIAERAECSYLSAKCWKITLQRKGHPEKGDSIFWLSWVPCLSDIVQLGVQWGPLESLQRKDSLTALQLPDQATRPLSIVLNVLVQARFYLATWYDEN